MNITTDFVWDLYNLVQDYKKGECGIRPLQEVLDEHYGDAKKYASAYTDENEQDIATCAYMYGVAHTMERTIKWLRRKLNVPDDHKLINDYRKYIK